MCLTGWASPLRYLIIVNTFCPQTFMAMADRTAYPSAAIYTLHENVSRPGMECLCFSFQPNVSGHSEWKGKWRLTCTFSAIVICLVGCQPCGHFSHLTRSGRERVLVFKALCYCLNCWKIVKMCRKSLNIYSLQIFASGEVPGTTYCRMWVGGQIHVVFCVVDLKYWAPTDRNLGFSENF